MHLIDTNAENDKKALEDPKVDFNNINNYYENADCIIMGYDITNKQSFEEIKSFWYNKIKEKNKTNLIYLLGNKIDLKDNIEINENEVKEFSDINRIKHFSISVKNNINIQNLIDDIKINIEIINNGINRKPKEEYKIVFVGDSGVGSKTSFIYRMATGVFIVLCYLIIQNILRKFTNLILIINKFKFYLIKTSCCICQANVRRTFMDWEFIWNIHKLDKSYQIFLGFLFFQF